MNSALRKRFQFRSGELLTPLSIPERIFLYHYTRLWFNIITKLRLSIIFKHRIENCDENAMASLNHLCRIKLLGVLLPLPDLAILIRVLHYVSMTQSYPESNSMEYQLFGRERQQVYSVFPNESFEYMVNSASANASLHQINSKYYFPSLLLTTNKVIWYLSLPSILLWIVLTCTTYWILLYDWK